MGSTEILLKSQKKESLPTLSNKLGQNFSGNGDFLPKTINTEEDLEPSKAPMITVGGDFSTAKHRIHIEDLGTMPLKQAVFGLKKKGANGESQHEIGYLGMGSDAGNGDLSLIQTDEGDRIHLNWVPDESMELYNEIANAVRAMSQNNAINGTYEDPEGYCPSNGEGLATAHPLGGCVMGDNITQGVVNPKGEVYRVPGLFVADGAIVPSALSVNPSFTITALAERVAYWMIYCKEMSAGDENTPSNS